MTINQIIRHEKLNLAERPCDPDPGYDFAKCVYQSIMKSAGCQPKWRKATVPGLPVCDDFVKLRQGSGKDRQGMAVKAKGLKA